MIFTKRGSHPLAASLDHIKPRSEGGKHRVKNIRLAHRYCNNSRRSMSVEQFRATLPNVLHTQNVVIELRRLFGEDIYVKPGAIHG